MRNLFLILLFSAPWALFAQTYFLNGDATSLGQDCYQLTGEVTYQNGTVWYADQIDLNQPLDIQFRMNFGTVDANGADGICFVLQTVGTSAIGNSGGGMGYLNFGTSLGIEFDTWQNGEYSDPTYDHIAIEINGDINHTGAGNISGPVQANVLDENIEDGQDHIVRIVWSPTDHIIQVYFDCVFRISGEIDLINDVFGGQNLVYWGFTDATGGSFNNQTVCLQESILNQTENVLICTGASTVLNAGGSSDGIYTWTPETFLDNPASGSPICNALVPTNYTVTFNDLCNVPTQLQFNVDVQDLAVSVGNIETLNCENNSSTVDAQLNMNLSASYTWSLNGTTVLSGTDANAFTTVTPGNFTLSVNVQDVCFADVTFEVPSDFAENTVDAGDDLFITCASSSVQINANYNGTNGIIAWQLNGNLIPNENQLSITASQTGTYNITILDPVSQCISTDAVFVGSDFTTPTVTIGAQDSLTCTFPVLEIGNITILSQNDYSVEWSTTDGSFAQGQNIVSVFVNAPGSYTITVQDNITGCTDVATTYVGVSDNYNVDLSSLSFPNVITSNGDSKNERWMPFLRNDPGADLGSVFGEYDLKIYNRWGNLVFESKSLNAAWTGKESEPGTYYYILHYKSICDAGKSGDISGDVLLMK